MIRAWTSTSALLMVTWGAVGGPAAAVSFQNPFHADQCDRAIAYAMSRLGGSQDARAEEILAEGLLCRGLAGDDWALLEAIERFEVIVRRRPAAIHAWVSLAEARRRHASASLEALEATIAARHRLDTHTGDGASRALIRHLRENEMAMREQREALLGFLERMEPEAARGDLSPGDIQRVASAAGLLGGAGREAARRVLARHRATARADSPMPAMIEVLETELDRGREPVGEITTRYERAARELCAGRWEAGLEVQICETVQARASVLRRVAAERSSATTVRGSSRKE